MMGEREGLKVLVAGVRLPPETFLMRLFEGLRQRGVRLTLAGGFHGFGRNNFPTGIKTINQRRFVKGRGWKRRKWDLVYFPWNSHAVSLASAAEWAHASIVSCRGSQIHVVPHNPRRTAFVQEVKTSLGRATLVHCVSRATQDLAVSLGAPEDRCRIIRPAVDPDTFSPLPVEDPNPIFRILMVGRLSWVKGYEYALLALAMLRHRGIHATLELVGTGPDIQRIRYTTHDLGLDDAVSVRGDLSPEHVRDAMKSHHVLLLTSVSEGISNTVLEGMSSGLPVVTTDCGGMSEAVSNGVEGIVVPVRDAFAVAGALEWLFRHPSERRAMGRAGRQRVMQEFTVTEQINKWITMIHEAIDLAGRAS